MSEEEKNKFQTTTISTIAIQSEKTRIVIALLQVTFYYYFFVKNLLSNLRIFRNKYETMKKYSCKIRVVCERVTLINGDYQIFLPKRKENSTSKDENIAIILF